MQGWKFRLRKTAQRIARRYAALKEMGLINYNYTTQINPSPKLPKEKIKDIRREIVQDLKSNDFMYGALDYDAKTISFDNSTVINRIFPFFGSKSYEIKLRECKENVEIEGTVVFGGVIVMTLISTGAFFFNLIFGLILLPILVFFMLFNYLSGKREIKDIINIGLNSDIPKKLEISKEQRNWIEDDSKCPACGHNIQPSTKVCPDCSLGLK